MIHNRRVTLDAKLNPVALAIQCQALGTDIVGDDSDSRKWVHVADEGQFLGYRDGLQPFAFSRDTFEQAIANVHAHPSFQAGADGEGAVDIIPWDFNHASEQDPTSGTIPLLGAPAQAWASDLKIVDGPDGKAQLHALTRFLDPARGYVKAGQYKWASIALTFNATDPRSGDKVGALITSIALTNTPFIEGMGGLVAAAKAGRFADSPGAALRRSFYEAARTPADAFSDIKDLFGLPETADAPAVLTEIGKVRQWVEAGTVPIGVDVDHIVGNMRTILGLPTLTPGIEVLDSTNEIIQRLIEDAAGVATPPAPEAPEAAETARRNYEMEIINILASKLGTRDNEDAVRASVEGLVALREGLVKLFGLDSHDAVKVILEAVEKEVGARDKLSALLKAIGVEDVDGGIEQIATLIQQGEELKTAMPELAGLKATVEKQEEAAAETDVAEAMASHNVPEAAREALLLMRKGNAEGFAKKFPKVEAPAVPAAGGTATAAHLAALQTPVAATPGGQELTVAPDGSTVNLGATPPGAPANGGTVNLSIYDGANPTAKAMTYLSRTMDGWDKMSHDERFKAAIALKRSNRVTFQPVQ